jgi:TolB protein
LSVFAVFAVFAILALAACGNGSPAGPSAGLPGSTPSSANGLLEGRLAFSSDRDGSEYIYVAEGSQVRRRTPGDRPAWSPDGHIVFHRPSGGGISVINANGSGERFLGAGFFPDWSPDGRKIVFTSGDGPDGGIFVMDADGTGVTKLLGNEFTTLFDSFILQEPAWSRNGRSIAFVRGFHQGGSDLWVMDADGSNPRRLSVVLGSANEPSWSSSGLQLGFQLFPGGAVAVVNADNSSSRIAIAGPDLLFDPDWYSNGAFVFSKKTGPGQRFTESTS